MMSLRDLDLKKSYDSDEDNILKDFYVPALSESVKYKRLTGFFTSTSLAAAARGISKLIKNQGEMKLITGVELADKDVEAIKKAHSNPKEILGKKMNREISEIDDEFVKDHVAALGWMIAKDKLEIKVALVVNENGDPIDKKTVNRSGIFHPKVGVMIDRLGNKISFSGGVNETASGWLSNIDEFKVFKGWREGQRYYLKEDSDRFEKFWEGKAKKARIMDIPTACENQFIEMAPESIDDLEKLDIDRKERAGKGREKTATEEGKTPWNIQREARDKWIGNNRKGILHMATGTGKTIAALACLEQIQEKESEGLVTVITTPRNHLVKQWIGEMEEYGTQGKNIIADSTNPDWQGEVVDSLIDMKLGRIKYLHVLTTHWTFPKDKFLDNLKKYYDGTLFLIADEVHGLGTKNRREGLIDDYNYRLGLSATPERYYDEEGTKELINYFDGTAFRFPLKDAINEVNPDTGETYLVPYAYKIHLVDLTEEELGRYREKTSKITKLYHQAEDDEEKEEYLKTLRMQRADITKSASNKYEKFEEILNDIGDVKHTIVFCHHEQIDRVEKISEEFELDWHRFTEDEGKSPKEEYDGRSEREQLLTELGEGEKDVLIAMGCLNEGVDVPSARRGIILSSSRNPREYVQRRGRVLRRDGSKEKAVIHDFLVVPGISSSVRRKLIDVERRIIEKEIDRAKQFIEAADNTLENINKIEKIEKELGISLDVF